jgi:outer membrane receptor protein involved in Fe transport
MTKSKLRLASVIAGVTASGAALAPAAAQPGVTVTDIEIPAIVLDQQSDVPGTADEAIDLANIVQSAAKGVTTVQEAPAIVTVITADEIKDRQFQDLVGVIDTVPGWQRVTVYNGNYPTAVARGQVQAIQFLHDGLSLFEPYTNESPINQVQPMELIKRVEMITGPGGVLWGSNSLLGIVNMITKDAEDVDGVEVGGQLGSGAGDRNFARAYAMVGMPSLANGKLKLFAHAAFMTYEGPQLELPLLLFHNALPLPNSANVYGPLTKTEAKQTMLFTIDGKATYGNLQLRVWAPFGAKYDPAGLSGQPVRTTLPQDGMCTTNTSTATDCFDPKGIARANRVDVYDRYGVLEYRTRFAHEKAGITARAYFQNFVRTIDPLQVLAPSDGLIGGVSVKADETSYRLGAGVDADVELAQGFRVLYGGEAFREWAPNTVTNALSGAGTQSELTGPYETTSDPRGLEHLPILCPRVYNGSATLAYVENCPLTFTFPSDRVVMGAYVDPQWRPSKELIFDLGGRIQAAPAALGTLHYDVNTTVAATAVWNFIPNWHLKLNYAQGFRPPAFISTSGNGETVQIAGNPKLKVETSDAVQAEVNARIFKGEHRIRELTFRVDGSYTRMHNFITISSGAYYNTGERGLASLEFLGKLYLQGGHRIEFGYTYLRGDTNDIGPLRSLPENSFTISGVWQLISNKLSATTTLKVTGAAEDPNRLVEYRGVQCAASDLSCKSGSLLATNSVTVLPTDLVFDRLPPIADLTLGLQYQATSKISVRATAYNALVSHAYQPDVYFDYEPHLEYLPNPYEGFRAFLSASYQY